MGKGSMGSGGGGGGNTGEPINREELENTIASLENVAPMVTLNLQEFCSQTLNPLRIHSTTLLNLGDDVELQTSRLDKLYADFNELKSDSSDRFRKASLKSDALDRKLSKTVSGLDEMGEWKKEVLAAVYKERQERETFNKDAKEQMDSLQSNLESKVEALDHRCENLEFDLASETAKRERVETQFTVLKKNTDEEIGDLKQEVRDLKKAIAELNASTSRLVKETDENTSSLQKQQILLVELENRDPIPQNLKNLPSDVDKLTAQLKTSQMEISEIDRWKESTTKVIEHHSSRLEDAFQEQAKTIQASETLIKITAKELENRLTPQIEEVKLSTTDLFSLAEGSQSQIDDLNNKNKYKISPADVLEILRVWDPVANKERTMDKPLSVDECIQSLETQAQGCVNMEPDTAKVHHFKELQELALENQRKIARLTSANVTVEDFINETTLKIQHLMDAQANALADALNKEPVNNGPDLTQVQALVNALKTELTAKALADKEKFNKNLIAIADKHAKYDSDLKELQEKQEVVHKMMDTSEVKSMMGKLNNSITNITQELTDKVSVDSMGDFQSEIKKDIQDFIQRSRLSELSDATALTNAMGEEIKQLLGDQAKRMEDISGRLSDQGKELRNKADQQFAKMVAEDVSNQRLLLDAAASALRADLSMQKSALTADIHMRLTEPSVREICERMIKHFHAGWVPANSIAAKAPTPDPAPAPVAAPAPPPPQPVVESRVIVERVKEVPALSEEDRAKLDGHDEALKMLKQQLVALERDGFKDQSLAEKLSKAMLDFQENHQMLVDSINKVRSDNRGKASMRQVQALDALLREIARHLMSGDESQVVLASKMGEIWKCLSCNKGPVKLAETAAPNVPTQLWHPSSGLEAALLYHRHSPEEANAFSKRPGSVTRSHPHPTQRPPTEAPNRPLRPSTNNPNHHPRQSPGRASPGRGGTPDQGGVLLPDIVQPEGFRPSSPMPPSNFMSKGRDLVGEIHKSSGLSPSASEV